MSTLDKSTGYWVSQIENVRDPIRTSHWRLRFNIPLIKAQLGTVDFLDDITSDDEISVMVKTAKIPKAVINTAEAWYMGQSVLFATNTTYDQESSFSILETANVNGYRFLGKWNQLAHNTDIYQYGAQGTSLISPTKERGINLGSAKYTSSYDSGKSVVRNSGWVYLELYDYTLGEVLLRVNYINIFPSTLGELDLSHEASDLGKYTATFKHDRFNITIPKNGTIS
jgi:hypothetical protein